MIRSSSLKWPILLGVALLALIVALLVFWIVGQAIHGQWALLTVGTVFFALVLIGVVIYVILTVKEVQLTRRQANFIDAVTHELKSPIASLKLYLQTMEFREVSPEQQREFHRFMLDDVQRLDNLIDHLLEAARLDHVRRDDPIEELPLLPLLQRCRETIFSRYQLTEAQVQLEAVPCTVRAREHELEMIITNLLDNAAKYAGQPPQVLIQVLPRGTKWILLRVSDNGKGVRLDQRRQIFRRFERGGTELERTSHGTGLGLYLVKQFVARLRGKIQVHGRGPLRGATFELELPGRLLPQETAATAPATPAPHTVPP